MAQTNGDVQMQEKAKDADSHVAPTLTGDEVDFEKISIAEAMRLLRATHHGLTSEEARKRIDEFGPNKLPEGSVNPLLRFLGYLWNPLSWAMEVAAILSIILLDYADFALIVALLMLNATISFVEESNADKAIKSLAAALAPKSRALRDGEVQTVDAAGLVPGDIIIIRLGDVIPADVKLLGEENDHEEVPMQIDQAALTGESLPAKKVSGNTAFSGSAVKQGEKHCLVYATGLETFFGRAAALISGTNNVANIQKIMTRIGGVCLITIFLWCIILLSVQFGYYRHACKLGEEECPTLTNLLVIIVGGIPIAMPTVISVTLALGAAQLAQHGAIVARMSAVEEMAGMDVLCSDKTGTLTLNKLTVERDSVYPMDNLSLNEMLKYGALSADVVSEEPIDTVLHESYPDNKALWKQWKRLKYVPFNPVEKFTSTTVEELETGKVYRIMKGAPQVVLKRAHNVKDIEAPVQAKITEYALRGLRALGLGLAEGDGKGEKPEKTKWTFLGLMPLFDPPRHDTKETIERCHHLGIGVKMITGDQQLIGKETARQLGMGMNIFKIESLLKAKSGGVLEEGYTSVNDLVERADGFAEVYPEHKFEIVQMLQSLNHVCGMTGDGVNDAPALKKADVGVAVKGATDAARGAADIVLTLPGLSVIAEAVIGARKIFQRMTTYAKYTVAMTFRICFTFGLLTVIYNWYFPTILIVLLAVFNDGAMIALSKDRVTPSATPNSWRLRDIFIAGIVYGLYLTLSSWVLFHTATRTNFFENSIKMHSLNVKHAQLQQFCTQRLPSGLSPTDPASALGGEYADIDASVLEQCVVEQKYVRGAMMRSLLYAQVSISGQALVFVTRTISHSFFSRAGLWTYVAFFGAQLAASIIAAFGFGGFPEPAQHVNNCQLCFLSSGDSVPFFSKIVPQAGTESVYTASVVGCTTYVIVAWIWSIIWYMGLDPVKWALAWALNEEGIRSQHKFREYVRNKSRPKIKTGEEYAGPAGIAPVGYTNPLGRTSIAQPPTGEMLKRASVVRVEKGNDGIMQVRRSSIDDRRQWEQTTGQALQRMSVPLGHQRTASTTAPRGSIAGGGGGPRQRASFTGRKPPAIKGDNAV